eukprot:scaffold19337_cov128-Isochrysis_galbana.AAC.1
MLRTAVTVPRHMTMALNRMTQPARSNAAGRSGGIVPAEASLSCVGVAGGKGRVRLTGLCSRQGGAPGDVTCGGEAQCPWAINSRGVCTCIANGKAPIVVVVSAPVSATSICTSGIARMTQAHPATMAVRREYVCVDLSPQHARSSVGMAGANCSGNEHSTAAATAPLRSYGAARGIGG